MYIIKNAFRNITRSKGRSILVFILILAIVISASVALSIQSSATNARTVAYESMSVTATIGVDRASIMNGGMNFEDPEDMQGAIDAMQGRIPNDELIKYSEAESVSDFYYTATVGTNGIEITPYESQGMMGGMGGRDQGMMSGMSSGDFSVIGSSSHNAMTEFIDGTLVVSDGAMFSEDESENLAVISAELAFINELSVGDSFEVVNPNNENDIITVEISGIFECESTDSYSNNIYISYPALLGIIEQSNTDAITYTSEMTGEEMSSAYTENMQAVYVFSDTEAFAEFEGQAEALGLDTESYAITSPDIEEFEASMVSLDNLSSFTMMFFLVVLVIGAIVLVVFQLFSVRERKYEMGVLAAIGMKKSKVSFQFLAEIAIITVLAITVGLGIGALVSQPIGDSLLESQTSSTQTRFDNIEGNFGGNFGGNAGESFGGDMGGIMGGVFGSSTETVDTIAVGMDFMVLLQVMGVGILLTLISGSVGLVSVLRYDPLKILSDRS